MEEFDSSSKFTTLNELEEEIEKVEAVNYESETDIINRLKATSEKSKLSK